MVAVVSRSGCCGSRGRSASRVTASTTPKENKIHNLPAPAYRKPSQSKLAQEDACWDPFVSSRLIRLLKFRGAFFHASPPLPAMPGCHFPRTRQYLYTDVLLQEEYVFKSSQVALSTCPLSPTAGKHRSSPASCGHSLLRVGHRAAVPHCCLLSPGAGNAGTKDGVLLRGTLYPFTRVDVALRDTAWQAWWCWGGGWTCWSWRSFPTLTILWSYLRFSVFWSDGRCRVRQFTWL